MGAALSCNRPVTKTTTPFGCRLDRAPRHVGRCRVAPPLAEAEAWRVDLRDHSIDVRRPGWAGVTTFRDRLTWRPPGFDSEFSLDIPAVFAGIDDDD